MSGARLLPANEPTIAEAARLLRDGRLAVFPTDTVYGVAAAVDRPEAVSQLYVVKGRPLDRPIAVLISDPGQVARLTSGFDSRILPLLERHWPGALTVVLPAAPWLPEEIVRGTGQVGLRVPDHPIARAIIAAAGGALATTSANRSGELDARTAKEAQQALGDRVALIMDGGRVDGGVPSTVVSFEGPALRLRVLRAGAIPADALPQALAGR